MKARISMMIAVFLLAMQLDASAGGLSAGIFNSYKGFGLSIDAVATEDIYNSYNLYADVLGMYNGANRYPGIKAVYLHYNKFASINSKMADYNLYLGPGASAGYVRDHASEKPGIVLTADLALAFRASFKKNIDMELGMVAELGFISEKTSGRTQIRIYNNGLMQALIPTLKIMYCF